MAARASQLPAVLNLDHVSPVTRLLAKRKQMLSVQNSLDAQKNEYIRKEELFKRREANLRRKDIELQEALVLFNKFLKENEHKRRRAEHKAADEIRKRQKWEKEIQLKTQKLADLQRTLAEKRALYKKYQPYMQFFSSIMEQYSAQFDDHVDAVLRRYTTLQHAHADLREQQQRGSQATDALRAEIVQYRKKMFHDSLLLNNDIARMSKDLETAVTLSTDAEESTRSKEAASQERMRLSSLLVMSIDNIYRRCVDAVLIPGEKGCLIQHALKKPTRDDQDSLEEMTKNQLDVIDAYLNDFAIIAQSGQQGGRPGASLGGAGPLVGGGGSNSSNSSSTGGGASGGMGLAGGSGFASFLGRSGSTSTSSSSSSSTSSLGGRR